MSNLKPDPDGPDKLKIRGMGCRAVANQTRFEIARQRLEDTEGPLGGTAAALSSSEASAFTRAFRRGSGRTPTAWRTESRHG
ncbi:helix-turn-helix domain-containing protein [Microvirga yunnanensis]|uniref:helix-turn-helix domain-containing protein n=1 Tax=Microvirga yunnanensis TaxID=2953740 RepID=UPI0021C5CAD0|nr:helix-turn-helix domain-containing protein [Microvirga sp. HBU65207]